MNEATKPEKTRLPSNLLRKILCKLGLHDWAGIYTKYTFNKADGTAYGIDWEQYCLYCPAERENPIHVR